MEWKRWQIIKKMDDCGEGGKNVVAALFSGDV
jgi:hypothetical protein